MIDVQEAVMEAVPVQKGVAVEVHELRKEFRRKDSRKRGEKRGERRSRVALDGVSFTMEKGETVAILGQNGSGKSTLVRLLSTLLLPDGGSARILGHDVVSDERAVRRLVNRVSVEASFFKKMSSAENLSYASRFYGMTSRRDTGTGSRRSSSASASRATAATEPMESLSRGMQQKVALARALLTSPGRPSARRADDGPRPALEARGAGVHPRDPRDARLDDPALHARPRRRPRCSRSGSASSIADSCSRSSRPTTLKRRYGADTLEEAFFAATGREFEAEGDDDDDREVFA